MNNALSYLALFPFILHSNPGNCMLNVPTLYDATEYNTHLSELPGTRYTLDEQCAQLLGTGSKYCGVMFYIYYIRILDFGLMAPGGSVSTKMCMHARYQIHGERGSFQWMCMHA